MPNGIRFSEPSSLAELLLRRGEIGERGTDPLLPLISGTTELVGRQLDTLQRRKQKKQIGKAILPFLPKEVKSNFQTEEGIELLGELASQPHVFPTLFRFLGKEEKPIEKARIKKLESETEKIRLATPKKKLSPEQLRARSDFAMILTRGQLIDEKRANEARRLGFGIEEVGMLESIMKGGIGGGRFRIVSLPKGFEEETPETESSEIRKALGLPPLP